MTPVRTVLLVASREVRQRLRSRLFVWSTIVISLVLTALATLPALVGPAADPVVTEPQPVPVAVVGDLTDQQREALEVAVGGALDEQPAEDETTASRLVEDGDVEFAVVDGERILAPPPAGLFAVGPGPASEAAEALALADVLDGAGVGDDVADALTVPPLPIETVGPDDPQEAGGRTIVANVGVVFLFAVLLMYASMIVNGIIEEKGSRVVELLVEVVPVRRLMAGKVLGLGLVGIGQTLVLFGPPVAVLLVTNPDLVPAGAAALSGLVVLWFVLGYAFYAVVAAGLGALVSRAEEAQAVLTPANVLMIGGYFVGFASISVPDSPMAVVAGWLPPTAPFVMLVRQAVGSPTAVEVAGSLVLTVAGIVAVTILAARVYEGGILRTGARVKLRDAWGAGAD